MAALIVTTEDLQVLKLELIEEMKALLAIPSNDQNEFLKSKDVRKMLGISNGTLQTLRVNGTLSFTKVGGTIYYKRSDVVKLLSIGRTTEKEVNNGRK